MILKIYRVSSCKYCSDRCEYKIEIEKNESVEIANKIQPSSEPFDEKENKNEYETEFIKELYSKLEYKGESPSIEDTQEIYDYVYDKLIKSRKSKYEDEILDLQKQSYRSTNSYTVGEPLPDGKFTSEQYVSSWYFTVADKVNTIYLIHNFNYGGGCGCFNSSYPLAVFSNKEDAQNFMKKCKNYQDLDRCEYGFTYFHLDTYLLKANTNVFEREKCLAQPN